MHRPRRWHDIRRRHDQQVADGTRGREGVHFHQLAEELGMDAGLKYQDDPLDVRQVESCLPAMVVPGLDVAAPADTDHVQHVGLAFAIAIVPEASFFFGVGWPLFDDVLVRQRRGEICRQFGTQHWRAD